MLNHLRFLLMVLLSLLWSWEGAAQKYQFSLKDIALYDQVHLTWHEKKNYEPGWIECRNDTFPWNFSLPGKDDGYAWDKARYLVLELEHACPTVVTLQLDFYSELYRSAEPDVHFKAGILPGVETRIVFPIRCLSDQSLYTPRHGRQLKGKVEGHMVAPSNLKKVQILFHSLPVESLVPLLRIHNIYLANEIPQRLAPQAKPLVDSLGQYAAVSWPGKTKSKTHLEKYLRSQAEEKFSAGEKLSQFRGNTDKKFPATGFFQTVFDGKRWWLADPEGNAFLSSGINNIRPSVSAAVGGIEDLFSWLPDPARDGQGFYFQSRGIWHFNFLARNLRTGLGPGWQAKWKIYTSDFLKSKGFNTVGAFSDQEFVRYSDMPYVWVMRDFPAGDKPVYRDFPDVFNPAYTDSLFRFALQLEERRNDRYLIGYFLGVEPNWAADNANLSYEMLKGGGQSFTRKRLVAWLSTKYRGDVARLNSAWSEGYYGFSDLDSGIVQNLGLKAQEDLALFTSIMVDTLIDRVCRTLKLVDRQHLNLGFRFNYLRPDICHRAENQFDVFSINGNGAHPPAFTEDIRLRTGKPVLITDFMVGATDRGLLSTGMVAVKNQEERGHAIQNYLEEGFSRPEVIGIHYAQLYDQPVLGRFDGENYGVGLMDVCNRPYEEAFSGFKLAHQRLHKVAAGKRSATLRPIQYVTPTWF